MKRQLAAILYADVAGYSRLTGLDEERTHRQLNQSLDQLIEAIDRHGGRKVHEAGDAVLAEFESVSGALWAAVEFQEENRARAAVDGEETHLQFRVGVNLGEVIHDRGDIYGDGVNLAARIQELAEPGGVCISGAVREQVLGKLDLVYDDLGYRRLKNISQSVHVYRARPAPDESSHPAAFLTAAVSGQPLFDLDGGRIGEGVLTTGRCLCGEVTLEISRPAIGTGMCHCRMCQRSTGAPVNAWAAFALDAVRFPKTEPRYYRATDIAERGFCQTCGARLTYRLLKPTSSAYLVVHIACLDNPEEFAPTWHGGIESQMPWFDVHDELPRTQSPESPALRKAWSSVGLNDPADWKERI